MKHLYKKIYEAINTGIQRALILDLDVSMNYQYKNIKNNDDFYILYVNILMNEVYDSAKEAYMIILNYYKSKELRYTPKDIFEYIKIFLTILYFNFSEKTPINIDWIDTSKFIKVILKDGSEKPIFLCKDHEKDAKFIKIIFPNKYEITIPKILKHSTDAFNWVIDTNVYKNNYNSSQCINLGIKPVDNYDFSQLHISDGYINTYENINIDNDKLSKFPAHNYVNSLPIIAGYKPYIPSIEELIFIFKYFPIIRFLLYRIGGIFKFVNAKKLLSSSEIAVFGNYCINIDFTTEVDIMTKTSSGYIIPLYKKIGDLK